MYDLDKQIGIHVMGDRPDITDASAFLVGETMALNHTPAEREWHLNVKRGYEARCEMEKLMNEVKGNE
jgi:hypothetical protein|tara:strand:+ start:70 stop:273 length:204 start_codon:yes stop_codon:yes gene_type:complete